MTAVIDPGTPAPVATPAPAAPAATPPAAPQVLTSDLPEQALKARLDQAKHAAQKELLDSLGITDPAQAKAAIEAAKALEDSKKTNEQKLAEQGLQLANLAAGVDAAVAVFGATITPEQKAAVDAIAGNDKAAWLKAYKALAPTWGATAPAAPAPVPATTLAAPPAAPTSTAPAAPAPPPTSVTTSPTDHAAVYASLKQSNPFLASNYLQQHGDACYPKT